MLVTFCGRLSGELHSMILTWIIKQRHLPARMISLRFQAQNRIREIDLVTNVGADRLPWTARTQYNPNAIAALWLNLRSAPRFDNPSCFLFRKSWKEKWGSDFGNTVCHKLLVLVKLLTSRFLCRVFKYNVCYRLAAFTGAGIGQLRWCCSMTYTLDFKLRFLLVSIQTKWTTNDQEVEVKVVGVEIRQAALPCQVLSLFLLAAPLLLPRRRAQLPVALHMRLKLLTGCRLDMEQFLSLLFWAAKHSNTDTNDI